MLFILMNYQEKTIPVTVDDNKMEKALLGQDEFSTLVSQITKRN